jgi:flavin-dependent dehydrogenase
VTVFDVAVVGAGPAGAATAIRLASVGRAVILLGGSQSSAARGGEVVGPDVRSILTQLGAWEDFLGSGAQPAHGIWSSWGSGQLTAKDFILSAEGPAWRVDRSRLDGALLAAARRADVPLALGCRRFIVRRTPIGWRIHARGSSETPTVDCRLVVDATGRAAAVARANGARWLARDRVVALVALLEPKPAMHVSADDVLLVESVPAGWWYSLVVPSGHLVATFVTDADLVRRGSRTLVRAWEEALDATEFTRLRAAGFVRVSLHVRNAGIGRLDRAVGPGWLAVGDAASTIDPLSGAGIAKALAGAILAGGAAHQALSGSETELESYAHRLQTEFETALRVGASYYDSERRWSDCPFWRRRHTQATGEPPWESMTYPRETR